jgi:hypothetical protein
MDELGSKSWKAIIVVICESRFDNKVPSDFVTEVTHTLRKFVQVRRTLEVSDAPDFGALLRKSHSWCSEQSGASQYETPAFSQIHGPPLLFKRRSECPPWVESEHCASKIRGSANVAKT